jgi:uncharacterized protein (DUF1015 family)
MAIIKPFRAVRPVADKVHLVASRSDMSYSSQTVRDELEHNPYTFIHIVHPEHGKKFRSKPNSAERFHEVKERYNRFLQEGTLIREDAPRFYLYRQIHDAHSHTGIIAAVSAQEYIDGHVKVHEHTLEKREHVFKEYLDITNFNAEPVLLTFRDEYRFHDLIRNCLLEKPVYDFTSTDHVRHQLWTVNNPEEESNIYSFFGGIDSLYIADGHHRCASSVLLAKERNSTKGENASGYFMAYLVPSADLLIQPFHRLVAGLTQQESEKLLHDLSAVCELRPCIGMEAPRHRRSIGVFVGDRWLMADFSKCGIDENLTDAALLTEMILSPLLGIQDLRNDPRISFSGGSNKIPHVEAEVRAGKFQIAFTLFPVACDELMAVSDRGEIMPPKSTWVEPKLCAGLTIYELLTD